MNRFTQHKAVSAASLSNIWRASSAALAVACIIFFVAGTGSVDSVSRDEAAKNLEKSVRRSVAQCYAVEGIYPPGLDYLREHYGLAYDERKFFIDYTAIGSNIMPDITILPRAKGDAAGNEGGLP